MLNANAFLLLAGDPEHWDTEIREKCRPGSITDTHNSEDLCALQIDQSAKGRRSAVLSLSMYGWCVRYDSGLQERAVLFSSKTHDPQKAYEFGCKWANEDPSNREFYVSRDDIHDHEQLADLVIFSRFPQFCSKDLE